MILIDANVLLYAYDSSSPHYRAARGWLETTTSKTESIGLSWMTLLAFIRISTSRRPLEHPFSPSEVVSIVSDWLEDLTFTIVNPGDRHWDILKSLMTKGQAHGPLIMDAHLAALAIEHGATLATCDRDFSRFPGLRTVNPLEL